MLRSTIDHLDIIHHPGGFWHGSPCHMFQPDPYRRDHYAHESPWRVAAVEIYLTMLAAKGWWTLDSTELNRRYDLRDLEVLSALYEILLENENDHPEIVSTLYEASRRGPVNHTDDCSGDRCVGAEEVVGGRALAFTFPNTPEGRDVIRTSLEKEAGDCHCWIRWDVNYGLDAVRATAIPAAKQLAFDARSEVSERARRVLNLFGVDIPQREPGFVAWQEADGLAELLLSSSKKDIAQGIEGLKGLYEWHPVEVGRAICDRHCNLSEAVQESVKPFFEPAYPPS